MGNQASSTSKLTNTQHAYVSAVQNTTNNSIAAAYNSAVISIRNVQGDVNLEGISVDQVAKAVAKAQFSNTNDSSILQRVSASLDNQAASLVKGIGLGNSSQSNATINNYVSSTMELSQQITNNCSATATNLFDISVDKVGGNVNVRDITVSQNTDAFQECMTQNEQKIVGSQVNEVKATNKSSAASIGMTGFGLVGLLIGLAVLFAVLGVTTIGLLGRNLTDPKFIGIAFGVFLIISGIGMIGQSSQTRIDYKPADCTWYTETYDTLKKQQANDDKNAKFVIKPFFFTCGIYGKGTNCTRLFNPPVIVGTFTTTPPPINLTATGGTNACTFAVHNLTNRTFTDVSDAYTAFRITADCKGLDVLYSLDGRVQYIFYKEVNPMCYHALHADLNQEVALWDGKTNWQNIERNPLFPPLMCTVLPCIEGVPSATDTLSRPYYIRISRNGFVYYFKNNAWVQVNPTSFWAGRTAPPLTNMLVYRGSPDKTPDLLNAEKNPFVNKDEPVAYIDINAITNGSYFDLYWKNRASDIATATDVLQGFTKIGTIDCSIMSNDGVVAYGPNPLLRYMNRTWVKIYDANANQDILSKEEITMLQSKYAHPGEEAYFKTIEEGYTKCQEKSNEFKGKQTNKQIVLYGGVGSIVIGLILCIIASQLSSPPASSPPSSPPPASPASPPPAAPAL